MICPICKRCPFQGGVCEDRVNRGRRFFLVGALALPVARRLEIAPAPTLVSFHRIQFTLHYDGTLWRTEQIFSPDSHGVMQWHRVASGADTQVTLPPVTEWRDDSKSVISLSRGVAQPG